MRVVEDVAVLRRRNVVDLPARPVLRELLALIGAVDHRRRIATEQRDLPVEESNRPRPGIALFQNTLDVGDGALQSLACAVKAERLGLRGPLEDRVID